MLTINPINTNVSFGRRIKLPPIPSGKELAAYASSAPTVTGTVAGYSTAEALGSTLQVAGTAFSAKAMGTNSSGIVPSVIEIAAPHATPATVAASHANPSFIGSILSSVGSWFNDFGTKVEKILKDPS